MSDQLTITNNIADVEAPPPLAPLTHVVISPSNIAAEQRKQRARTLSFGKRWRIKRQINRLSHTLKNHKWKDTEAQIGAIKEPLQKLMAEYHNAKSQGDTEKITALKPELAPLYRKWQVLQGQARKVRPVVVEYGRLSRALEDHRIALERDKLEQKLIREMETEARIYETLIIDRWTRLGFCHKRTEKGRQIVDKVEFSEVGITLDAIYFKIDAGFQTFFKNWQTNVPDGVYITDLISEKVLHELTIACQRQVTGVFNHHNGAWIIVHRLESVDGLMNYVKYTDVMNRYPAIFHDRYPICVGVGGSRQIQWVNLADFPHWLIAGYTGAGKSNQVNVVICSLISKHKPDDLRLVLIDLKGGLEFSYYEKIPHLHGGIVDHIEGVADKLAELEAVMADRFKKFRGIAKRIEEYHAKRPNDAMPRVVALFDEVASIEGHGDITKRINASLRGLVQKGRAVGIHIILCTQRPDTNAIPGNIKANLAVRITGRMVTAADSMTILGNAEARKLAAVPGRMMLQIGADPQPIQTPHIDEIGIADALRTALAMTAPAHMLIEDGAVRRIIHQQWTVERVIELSLNHLGGNVSAKRIYEAADDLTQSQARELVEKIWAMEAVEYNGQTYRVAKKRSNVRMLEPA